MYYITDEPRRIGEPKTIQFFSEVKNPWNRKSQIFFRVQKLSAWHRENSDEETTIHPPLTRHTVPQLRKNLSPYLAPRTCIIEVFKLRPSWPRFSARFLPRKVNKSKDSLPPIDGCTFLSFWFVGLLFKCIFFWENIKSVKSKFFIVKYFGAFLSSCLRGNV